MNFDEMKKAISVVYPNNKIEFKTDDDNTYKIYVDGKRIGLKYTRYTGFENGGKEGIITSCEDFFLNKLIDEIGNYLKYYKK
jgi:hypothetical protein